jgi:hypothetical protein
MQVAAWLGKRLMRPYACKFVPSPQDQSLMDELQTREPLDMDPSDTAFGAFDSIIDHGLLVRKPPRSSTSVGTLLMEAATMMEQAAQSDGSGDDSGDESEDAEATDKPAVAPADFTADAPADTDEDAEAAAAGNGAIQEEGQGFGGYAYAHALSPTADPHRSLSPC